MRAADIRDRVRAQPFEPFFLHLSDGTQHEVRHPEMILVTQRRLVIGEPSSPVEIDPVHVTHMTSPERTST